MLSTKYSVKEKQGYMNHVSVVMATLNEEEAVGEVIGSIRRVMGNEVEIVLVDSSTDQTAEIAQQLGARVIKQPRLGYGIAMQQGMLAANGEIIVTLDCDGTYPVDRIPDLVQWIEQGWDIVSGSRLRGRHEGMVLLNRLANWVLAWLARVIYHLPTTDLTTGMRAYRREIIHRFNWRANQAFTAELVIRPVRAGYRFKEIAIDYGCRKGGETKLHRFKSGMAYLRFLFLEGGREDRAPGPGNEAGGITSEN